MSYEKDQLRIHLMNTLDALNKMIDRVYMEAMDIGVSPIHLKTADGQFLLGNLLASKAQCLHALALLKENSDEQ